MKVTGTLNQLSEAYESQTQAPSHKHALSKAGGVYFGIRASQYYVHLWS